MYWNTSFQTILPARQLSFKHGNNTLAHNEEPTNDDTAAEPAATEPSVTEPSLTEHSASEQNDNAPLQPLLSSREARILGALMEKQLTTPDAYPLTVNSLINACNQKSSREPVTSLQQGEVVKSLRELEGRRLVRYEMGARSERYEQTLTQALSLSRKQHALLCVMLLRGPQTANELLTRTQRLYSFENSDDMQVSLTRMTQGEKPVVRMIGRAAGQRDDRYGHLLCGDTLPAAAGPSPASDNTDNVAAPTDSNQGGGNNNSTQAQLQALTDEVIELRDMLEQLYQLTGHNHQLKNQDD